jgi:hypothetical protein
MKKHENCKADLSVFPADTVIGSFSMTRRGDSGCDGPACLIAGSYKSMKEFLSKPQIGLPRRFGTLQTTHGEIGAVPRMSGIS